MPVEPKASRLAKDHLFVDMFNRKEYCLQLYKALHPEETNVTEADISNITLSHVIVDRPYNDLGFTVGNRLLVLVEAQSAWSGNIPHEKEVADSMIVLFEQEEAVKRYGNRIRQETVEKTNRNTARRIVRNGGDVQMILKLTDLTEAEAQRIYDEETGDDKDQSYE